MASHNMTDHNLNHSALLRRQVTYLTILRTNLARGSQAFHGLLSLGAAPRCIASVRLTLRSVSCLTAPGLSRRFLGLCAQTDAAAWLPGKHHRLHGYMGHAPLGLCTVLTSPVAHRRRIAGQQHASNVAGSSKGACLRNCWLNMRCRNASALCNAQTSANFMQGIIVTEMHGVSTELGIDC